MKRFLVLVAMDNEFVDFVKNNDYKERKLVYASLWEKQSQDKMIAIVKTGVGPINASMTLTEILLDQKYDEVVLLGLGGAVDPTLDAGDIVIGSSIVQHDAICSFDDRIEFMAAGELHLSLKVDERKNIEMLTSPVLNDRYRQHLASGFKTHLGLMGSGSEFVGSKARKLNIKERLPKALMVDMEAAAVAYVCQKNNLPFTVIKTVADTLKENSTGHYVDFIKSNAKKCAEIIDCMESL